MQSSDASVGDSAAVGSFSGRLAGVIYVDPQQPSKPALADLSSRVAKWVQKATRADMHRHCSALDSVLMRRLSGEEFLRVAVEIEKKAPEVIDNMPRVKQERDHLRKAEQLAAIFQPAALERLAKALAEEGSR